MLHFCIFDSAKRTKWDVNILTILVWKMFKVNNKDTRTTPLVWTCNCQLGISFLHRHSIKCEILTITEKKLRQIRKYFHYLWDSWFSFSMFVFILKLVDCMYWHVWNISILFLRHFRFCLIIFKTVNRWSTVSPSLVSCC